MEERILTSEAIKKFEIFLREEEKSENTIEKYLRDIKAFINFADKDKVIDMITNTSIDKSATM